MPIFSSEALDKVIKETIASLPSGHENAVVGLADTDGVKIIVGVRRDLSNKTFEIQGAYSHDWDGEDAAKAKLLMSW